MTTYISFMFWFGVVMFVVRLFVLGLKHFPYETEKTLGSFVAETILSLAFTIWAGLVLFTR